jgi:hypothetical protein
MKGNDDKPLVFILEKIPEGGRLEGYLEGMSRAVRTEKSLAPFLLKVFDDCWFFVSTWHALPQIEVRLIPTTEKFRKLEGESGTAISTEEPRKPELITGFNVGDRIYINLAALAERARDTLNFVMSVIETYLHEITHIAFPGKTEQETYDMQCSLVESFLDVKLPANKKTMRASDYYYRTGSAR